jgi:hypothetical protein
MINYAVFSLIKLELEGEGCSPAQEEPA